MGEREQAASSRLTSHPIWFFRMKRNLNFSTLPGASAFLE
jgi:hypothetical protein